MRFQTGEARLVNEKKNAIISLKVCVKELDSNVRKDSCWAAFNSTGANTHLKLPSSFSSSRTLNHLSSQQVRAIVVHPVEIRTYSMLGRLLRKQEVHGCFI